LKKKTYATDVYILIFTVSYSSQDNKKNCELLVNKPSPHLIRFYVTLRSLSALKG